MDNLNLKKLDKFAGREGPLVMIIMDGVGLGKKENDNAFFLAKTSYLDKLQAEKNLSQTEQLIQPHVLPKGVTIISTAICGVTFYRVTVTGQYHHTKTTLQSTYALIGDTSNCNPKPTINAGRQSWKIS